MEYFINTTSDGQGFFPRPWQEKRTHSQATARKRKRKDSWGSLNPRVLARMSKSGEIQIF